MAITLGALTLPDGLVWSDEDAWSPIAQSIEYGLTGSQMIVDGRSNRAGGRSPCAASKMAIATPRSSQTRSSIGLV